MRVRSWHLAVVSFAAVLGSEPLAQAQGAAPIDLQIFHPAVDSKGYITLNGSQILGHLDVSFGLVTNWGRNVLTLGDSSSSNLNHFVVQNILTPQLQVALGLFKVFELGLGLPLTVTGGQGFPAYR